VYYLDDMSSKHTKTLSLSLLGLIGDATHALHWAANHGCRPLVLHLTKSRPRLKARTDSQGQTPLHLAAAAGHAGLVPLLLTPATLEAADSNNQTALQLAVQNRQAEAAAALLAAGASLGEFKIAARSLLESISDGPPQLPLVLLNAMLADPGAAAQVAQALQWPHGCLRDALHLAATSGSQELVAKLLEAGADRGAGAWDAATPLALAAERGRTCAVLVLLKAMVRRSQQQQQQQQQGQGQEQAWLVSQVAAAIRSVLKLFVPVDFCSQLLEAVLDVLGPQVTGDVCQAVQQQLQQALDAPQQQLQQAFCHLQEQPAAGGAGTGPSLAHEHHFTQFAEALLVAWVGVEERLHAGRQPLARLQRLVPGLGDGRLQQQQQPERIKEGSEQRLVQLVEYAESAAAAGQQQRAHALLQEFAALFRQHQHEVGSRCADEQHFQKLLQGTLGKSPSSMFIRLGLSHASHARRIAAMMGHPQSGGTSAPRNPAPLWQAQALHPPAVYTTFLAAWVGARRRLQQLPREMVTTVVAAVQAAQQQQRQFHDEAKEAAGTAGASGGETQERQRQRQPVAKPPQQQSTEHTVWRQLQQLPQEVARTEVEAAQQQQQLPCALCYPGDIMSCSFHQPVVLGCAALMLDWAAMLLGG
jgi:hypothetical protein